MARKSRPQAARPDSPASPLPDSSPRNKADRGQSSDATRESESPAGSGRLGWKRLAPRGLGWTGLAAGLLLLTGGGWVAADWWSAYPDDAPREYVGRQTCAACHQPQHDQWLGSHHDLAMDRATEETVLADFNEARLEHHGITSRMFRRDGKFLVHTEGPDGRMADFEVKYVFGVEPLQQYMVEFDRPEDLPDNEIARLQVLRLSWDTQRKRWFYLAPPDVDEKLAPDDDLHWTGIAQRWNTMCAECHSTNVRKGFDPRTQVYHTTFSEIDVSCEACHGPGSLHVQLARDRSLFWDRKHGYGLAPLKDPNAETEIQSCAPCHSRRRPLYPDFQPGDDYFDYYATELLDEMTYHADGQILDEVYVHGSFLQSKMYHKGIRCTDCHNPHTTKLKHQGNQVCTSCHAHPAGKYDTPAHHQHQPGSSGASCVACHMPATTYMAVDPRRDHSLRIPRPDLSERIGTPNACSGCHLRDNPLDLPRREDLPEYADWLRARREGDEEAAQALARLDAWCAEFTKKWYGDKPDRLPHYGLALDAGRRDAEGAAQSLAELARDARYPAIARATAVSLLARYSDHDSLKAARDAAGDPHPLVRGAAVQRLQQQRLDDLIDDLAPLLDDPVRLVRTEAARALAAVPDDQLRASHRARRERGLEEYVAGLLLNNDRAGAHLTLGSLYEERGRLDEAIAAYETAIRTQPAATGPRTNLAALRDRQADALQQRLEQALQRGDSSQAAALQQQIQPLRDEAAQLRRDELPLLARDANLAPDSGAIQYRYGLALYLDGQLDQAETALERACQLDPQVPDFWLALARFHQQRGQMPRAVQAAEQLVKLQPRNPMFQQLLRELQQPPSP